MYVCVCVCGGGGGGEGGLVVVCLLLLKKLVCKSVLCPIYPATVHTRVRYISRFQLELSVGCIVVQKVFVVVASL